MKLIFLRFIKKSFYMQHLHSFCFLTKTNLTNYTNVVKTFNFYTHILYVHNVRKIRNGSHFVQSSIIIISTNEEAHEFFQEFINFLGKKDWGVLGGIFAGGLVIVGTLLWKFGGPGQPESPNQPEDEKTFLSGVAKATAVPPPPSLLTRMFYWLSSSQNNYAMNENENSLNTGLNTGQCPVILIAPTPTMTIEHFDIEQENLSDTLYEKNSLIKNENLSDTLSYVQEKQEKINKEIKYYYELVSIKKQRIELLKNIANLEIDLCTVSSEEDKKSLLVSIERKQSNIHSLLKYEKDIILLLNINLNSCFQERYFTYNIFDKLLFANLKNKLIVYRQFFDLKIKNLDNQLININKDREINIEISNKRIAWSLNQLKTFVPRFKFVDQKMVFSDNIMKGKNILELHLRNKQYYKGPCNFEMSRSDRIDDFLDYVNQTDPAYIDRMQTFTIMEKKLPLRVRREVNIIYDNMVTELCYDCEKYSFTTAAYCFKKNTDPLFKKVNYFIITNQCLIM